MVDRVVRHAEEEASRIELAPPLTTWQMEALNRFLAGRKERRQHAHS